MQVALLSAKTFETFEGDLETENLEGSKVASIAEIEVFYMTTCTFRKPGEVYISPIHYDTIRPAISDEEFTFDYSWVSVLKCTLPNLDDDDEPIRWKVTQNRIASEFPNR